MKLVEDVFTPSTVPTHTDVKRSEVLEDLLSAHRTGGLFIDVAGTTKFGKTTLVQDIVGTYTDAHFWLDGQDLVGGVKEFWTELAHKLKMPVSIDRGTTTSDNSSWGILSALGLAQTNVDGLTPGGVGAPGSETSPASEISLAHAVKEAISLLRSASKTLAIVIDDFHFITDVEVRRDIILALRPITKLGVSAFLVTLPRKTLDPAYQGTNIGGRHASVQVPTWRLDDLQEIAAKGFDTLNVWAPPEITHRLATESCGSPQIMQTLLLKLCRSVNSISAEVNNRTELKPPTHWETFFRSVKDLDAFDWLGQLGGGPTARRRRTKYELAPYGPLDGYQLILLVMRDAPDPTNVPMADAKSAIGRMLSFDGTTVSTMNVEQKAQNMSILASKEMTKALEKYRGRNEESEQDEDNLFGINHTELKASIPQPVFAYRDDEQVPSLRILDPLLAYSLKWHEDAFLPTSSK